MKKILGLWVVMFIHNLCWSQSLTIKNSLTNQPINLVTIYSKKNETSAITDEQGMADISEFKGADSIIFRLIGFESKVHSYLELEKMNFLLLLDESKISLGEHVVSATRWKQSKRDVPNKITTIKPSEIVQHNPQTAADLLQLSGEVYVQKSQLGGGSPMIRGFATNRVLLAVDGVRMNTAIFRSGNVQNVISLDPFATENTEIIFGPGSVIYGSDAIGGVMNFYTLSPILCKKGVQVNGNALVRFASANFEKTGHWDFRLGAQKWGFATSVSFSDFDDLVMGSHGPEEYLRPEYVEVTNGIDSVIPNQNPKKQVSTGYSQINLMQKVRFKPNENWEINYGGHYSSTSNFDRYDRLLRYTDGKPRSAEWFYGPQVWGMNTIKVENGSKNILFDDVRLTLAHQYFEESRHDRNYKKDILRHRIEKVNAASVSLDMEKTLNENHRLFYGADGVYNLVNSLGKDENIESDEVFSAPTRYPDGSTWSSGAVYVNHRYKINEKVSMQSGARYNQVLLKASFDNKFYDFPFQKANINTGALTGSLGLAYNPFNSLQINVNGSTGFRAPNVDDIGKVFDSEPGAVVVPNPNLKSEYAYNGEVGIAKIFKEVIKFDITGYYTLLKDALVRRDFSFNGKDSIFYDGEKSRVQAVQNAAIADVYGVQTGVEIKLPFGFEVNSRFNYQKGEEELEDGSKAPLRHAPPWFGSSHITFNKKSVKIDFYSIYNGEVSHEDLNPSEKSKEYLYAMNEDGNAYSPMWYTLNAKAMVQLKDYLLFSVGMENITDLRYKSYASGIAAPGRNLIATVKATL